MKSFFYLLRIHQWVKNTFIFLPIFFAGELFDSVNMFFQLLSGFIAFSLMAASVYIINDYMDIAEDRIHPEKYKRPLASGEISNEFALVIFIILLVLSPCIAYFVNVDFMLILILYFVINVFYSLKLKHVPILDLLIIATGFLLRVISGGLIADVLISKWIILMTFLLALFLGFAKRRDDVIIFNQSSKKMRQVVDGYNLEFINSSMILMAAVIVVSYIMYTTSPKVMMRIGSNNLYITTLFVISGLLRYLQISLVENNSGSPTRFLLKDRFIQLTILGWMTSFYFLLYI